MGRYMGTGLKVSSQNTIECAGFLFLPMPTPSQNHAEDKSGMLSRRTRTSSSTNIHIPRAFMSQGAVHSMAGNSLQILGSM
jgi:hypothetical protein